MNKSKTGFDNSFLTKKKKPHQKKPNGTAQVFWSISIQLCIFHIDISTYTLLLFHSSLYSACWDNIKLYLLQQKFQAVL